MTGAQIPNGADAVVMFEQTIELEDTFTIRKPFSKNENISLKGEETKTGDVVLKKGQVINPGLSRSLQHMAMQRLKLLSNRVSLLLQQEANY